MDTIKDKNLDKVNGGVSNINVDESEITMVKIPIGKGSSVDHFKQISKKTNQDSDDEK